jgi:periplasmic protein TonB
MNHSLLLAAALALLAGCATKPLPSDPEYQVSPSGKRQTKHDAERAHAGASPPAWRAEEADTPPKVLSAHFPDYPVALRRAEITGRVLVRFTVELDGSVSGPSVQGTPPKELAALALSAIARWKFSPATKGGVPVRAQIAQPFAFELE